MKHVLSVSLGSSKRDHTVEVRLCGELIRIERRGVDGSFAAAREMFLSEDGQVDAFGLGGAEFGLNVAGKYFALRSVKKLVAGLKTPVTDGSGIRNAIERDCASWLLQKMQELGDPESLVPKRVLFCVASGRFDLVEGFARSGFEMKFGDAGFILGLPLTTVNFRFAKLIGRIYIPLIVRAPFSWLYPTGSKQELSKPKFGNWYDWATVIADDFHYIKKHLPERLDGKVIVTNTTTQQDVELLRERGARWLCTTTPRFNGRSFGTNTLEAALTAVAGRGRVLTNEEVEQLVTENGLEPEIRNLQDS